MKKTNSKSTIVWIVGGIIVLAIVGLLVKSGNKPQSIVQNSEHSSAQGSPYFTSGGNEEQDDNFYTPGQMPSIASLASKDKNTLVWISASWCEVCHAMRPFVAKVANKYADKLALKEINFNDNYNNIILPNHWFGTPIFLILGKGGNIKDSFSGATEETFDAKLKAASEL